MGELNNKQKNAIQLKSPLSLSNLVNFEAPRPNPIGIHNRRSYSPLLRNVYPSGFNSLQIRLDDPSKKRRKSNKNLLKSSMSPTSHQQTKDKNMATRTSLGYSFVDWTKGNVGGLQPDSSLVSDRASDDDYAEVAGAYFKEINRENFIPDSLREMTIGGDLALSIQSFAIGANQNVSMDRQSKMTPRSSPKNIDSTQASPSLSSVIASSSQPSVKVVLLPPLLPGIKANRPNTIRSFKISSKVKESATKSASHGVGDSPSKLRIDQQFTDEILVPSLLPMFIQLELIPFKQLFESSSLVDVRSVSVGVAVPFSTSLRGLHDIAKAEYELSSTDGQEVQELELAYFNPKLKSWRLILSKTDWENAKFCVSDVTSPDGVVPSLRVMYSRGKHREIADLTPPSLAMRINAMGSMSSNVDLTEDSVDRSEGRRQDRRPLSPKDGVVVNSYQPILSRTSSHSHSHSMVQKSGSGSLNGDESLRLHFSVPDPDTAPYNHRSVIDEHEASYTSEVAPNYAKQSQLAVNLEQRLQLRKR